MNIFNQTRIKKRFFFKFFIHTCRILKQGVKGGGSKPRTQIVLNLKLDKGKIFDGYANLNFDYYLKKQQ